MQLKKSLWMPAAVALIAAGTGGWLLQQGGEGNVYLKARVLQDVIRTVSDRYVEDVDPADLYDLAIDGLLEKLGDPHTSLLRPEEYADLRLTTTGNYGGLGIRIDQKDDWITVVQTLPKTPAERAGLRPGDRIIEVDGESALGWKPDDAVRVLRGPKGAPVNLKISRVGVPEPIPIRIVRDEIHVEYVTFLMYEPEIGYISHQQFSAQSADDIRKAIVELKRQGMKALILDLRANPGGLLEEGVAVSDLFLEDGSEVVETRSRMVEQNDTYVAKTSPVDRELPVIVLVDGFSASASEIVAGALQDHDRALVVGTPTFGKGSVQTLYQVSGGNYLKITTAKWYTPSGRSIHRERDDAELLAMARGLRAHGAVTDPSDTAGVASREIFYTDGGREVYGGGGIMPDLIVQGDTLTLAEQQYRAALGDRSGVYADAMFRFAVEYANDHPDLDAGFEVTAAMLDQFYSWILDHDIQVSRELYDGARRLVSRNLGIQLATVALDESESMRRRLVLDRQIETAVELLREGATQKQLFVLADMREDEMPVIREQ